jgi:hypothetical protein
MSIRIVTSPIRQAELLEIAKERFGDMVKGVADIEKNIIALGGELHADEERMLLEHGSAQKNLWGFNIYVHEEPEEWLEFDSMINIRPGQGNRSRTVEDPMIQNTIRTIVRSLIQQ